jgi:outer membrane protein assembly factor BamB
MNRELDAAKGRRRLIGLSLALFGLLGAAVHGSDNPARLTVTGQIPLPTQAVLDDQTVPLLASDKKAGFISSITDGSVISFSTVSGKVMSSVAVGESAARLSMVELPNQRLLAAPTVNAPDRGRPATISIIDAINPRRLTPTLLMVLPATAQITSATQAVFTPDGRFVLIASQFNDPALLCYSVETGQMVSQVALIGAPSQVAVYQAEGSGNGAVAVSSVAANTLSLMSIDQDGMLAATGSFTPAGPHFDEVNNPVFSSDGQRAFIASAAGQQLFAVDSTSGALLASAQIAPSPEKIALAAGGTGDLLAVTCVATALSTQPGGVAIVDWSDGQFSIKAEFNPSAPIEFSRNNNVALSDDGTMAFVGSKTGVLFAFDTATGQKQSRQEIGAELMGVGLGQQQQIVAAVHRTNAGDEIAIASFDTSGDDDQTTDSAKADAAASEGAISDAKKQAKVPVIGRLVPDTVLQGRTKRLTVVVHGQHFKPGSVVLHNGTAAPTTALSDSALQIELHEDLFTQVGSISIQVRDSDGISQPVSLEVVATAPPPTIIKIVPDTVQQGRKKLELVVHGQLFSPGAVVVYNGSVVATTTAMTATTLQASLPKALFSQAGAISIQVKDKNGILSQPASLAVVSTQTPIIKAVSPQKLDAPHPPFEVKVKGSNFRQNSVIQAGPKLLKTTFVSASILTATVPAVLSKSTGTLNIEVIDNKGKGNSSNVETIALLGPQITGINVIKNPLLAGTGHFRMEVKGRNFRIGARVLINGSTVPKQNAERVSDVRIKVEVPGSLNQDSGTIPVVVRNPDGSLSTPVTFTASGPEITSVKPAQLIAGESDVDLEILGQNFRGLSGVVISPNGGTGMQLDTKFFRFVSKHKVIVKLKGKLNSLLAQPGTLSIQILNPNKTSGVLSTAQSVTVAAPQITSATLEPDKAQPGTETLTIIGSSFREGAVVDFVAGGEVVLERTPDVTKLDRLVVTIKKGKVTALGQFEVQVVNPGKIISNAVTPSS